MAQHRTLATFPPAATGYPHHRALARLHADGAVVARRGVSPVGVIAREERCVEIKRHRGVRALLDLVQFVVCHA
jgi:hypothetical protein